MDGRASVIGRQLVDQRGPPALQQHDDAPVGCAARGRRSEWTDYAIEITLSDEGSDVGLALRYTNVDRESYYRLRLNASGRFLERVADRVEVLWQDEVAYAATTGVVLAVQCEAGRLRAQLDDELLFDVDDAAPLLTGQVGIFANVTAAFEQFPGSHVAGQCAGTADAIPRGTAGELPGARGRALDSRMDRHGVRLAFPHSRQREDRRTGSRRMDRHAR